MSIPKMTGDLAIIQKLNDLPNAVDGLTAQELKARFDESGLSIQRWINEVLLPGFQAKNMAFSGNASLNADTVQAAIEAVHAQVRDASSGTIVDGAVTKEKLAVNLLERVYGGRPWVSLNTPGSAQNMETDFPIGQIWLRPSFTVVNAAGSGWQGMGCTVTEQEHTIHVTGDQTVVSVSASQVISGIGQAGDRVMLLFDIRNKDSEITNLTVSLNSGEALDVSAGVFESTLVGGALTVEFIATWPSTSLAGGSFDVVNYTVVNLDQVLRQTADAEDMADWAAYLRELLPLDVYVSPEAVFIQTINGSWWPMGYSTLPVNRGGTGNRGLLRGEMLYGGNSAAMERLEKPAENYCVLQFVDGVPRWQTLDDLAVAGSFVRTANGSYTGTGTAGFVTLPCSPRNLKISSGWYSAEVRQGGSSAGNYTGIVRNTSTGETSEKTYQAGVTLNGNRLDFWFNKPYLGRDEVWQNGDAVHWNASGSTYSWEATY